jgi:hypothetical protein
VTIHRSRNPAADHAAEPVAIYALQAPDELGPPMNVNEGELASQ